ncbi:MAG: ribonuclease [Actinomycetota bacterium]|nr:ribonuclease [Actinomycetota bacterium]
MLDNEPTNSSESSTPSAGAAPAARRRSTTKKAAASAPPTPTEGGGAAVATPRRRATKKTADAAPAATVAVAPDAPKKTGAKKAAAKKAAKRAPKKATEQSGETAAAAQVRTPPAIPTLLFQPPSAENAVAARPARQRRPAGGDADSGARADSATGSRADSATGSRADSAGDSGEAQARDSADGGDREASGPSRSRRRRGGRGRRGGQGEARETGGDSGQNAADLTADSGDGSADGADAPEGGAKTGGRTRSRGGRGGSAAGAGTDGAASGDGDGADDRADGQHGDDGDHDGEGSASSRRRRRRRSRGAGEGDVRSPDDPPNTVVRIRAPREHEEGGGHGGHGGVQGVKGSTRLEAKKQRRREGREQGRHGRRGLVITESEFLARRESVDRIMAVRQRGDRTQIGVLEDGVLVEHFVSTASTNRMVGNVFLGRVQNVLSGMEAAFVDIGKGRNAVLYAGEVNFDTSGLEGGPRRIESALKPGQAVVVQVTKDPIGHKGARLTSQVSLPGRYLVYVPEGSMMGISRKLPDVERSRLKAILKKVTPEGAGVIVRTAAEGASEEDLTRDVARLAAQWEDIKKKSETANAPALLYSEPDLTIRVIRDVFNEDFNKLIVQADTEWDTVEAYVGHVAPDLVPRLSRWTSEEDIFTQFRVDEQIAKALDRKVWLPSGGYLVIDRTEAMIVIDVNTGRFIGKGGNLEETVTKNNLEAAEEIVRQLRLRDIGGIIVIDFIDMVLEANRDLVLRRLIECLGRDRTKHQVAEVTSLGLVQMTRKRVGNGLLEAFSEVCEVCNGRGVIVHTDLVEQRPARQASQPKPGAAKVGLAKVASARGQRGGRGRAGADGGGEAAAATDSVGVDGAGVEGESPVQPAADSAVELPSDALADSPSNGEAPAPTEETPAATGDAPAPTGATRSRRGGRRRGGSKSSVGADNTAAGDSGSGNS